jgi:hypothetical protein
MGRACRNRDGNAQRVLVERPEGRRPLGRPRHRWEDNIRMDLREIGCLVNTINCWEVLE